MCKKIHYIDLQPKEFVEKISSFPVAYFPLGTLEWHGRHMPLGADGIQAQGVFELLAEKYGGIVLPMLFVGPDCMAEANGIEYYGMETHGFEKGKYQYLPGNNYYIEEDLFAKLLDSIMRNLSRSGFKIVMAHGHGPSTDTFRKHKEEYFEKYGLITYCLFDLGYTGFDGIQTDHAATNETSITMALKPDLVNLNNLPKDKIPVSVSGRDPRLYASIEEGKRVIELNVSKIGPKLCEIVNEVREDKAFPEFHDIKSLIGKGHSSYNN